MSHAPLIDLSFLDDPPRSPVATVRGREAFGPYWGARGGAGWAWDEAEVLRLLDGADALVERLGVDGRPPAITGAAVMVAGALGARRGNPSFRSRRVRGRGTPGGARTAPCRPPS